MTRRPSPFTLALASFLVTAAAIGVDARRHPAPDWRAPAPLAAADAR